MLDIVENEEIDRDTVGPDELDTLFDKKYIIASETTTSLNKSYINKLSVSKSLNVAVSLVDNSVEVYQLNNVSLSRVCRLSGHKKSLTEVVFCPKDPNLLYTSSHDGVLKLWDIRDSGTCVQEYKDKGDIPKSYECMDVSHNGRVLCAGSQLVEEDAYLVFWDQRNPEPLGGYWNCHTDDITQVKFHETKTETLASGSLDGLVNIYDVSQATEDDALLYSLNADSSVEQLAWAGGTLACVAQPAALRLWDAELGDLLAQYDRDRVARAIKRSREDECYVAGALAAGGARAALAALAGSHAAGGEVLRSVRAAGRKLLPDAVFQGNRQVVRCCWHDPERDIVMTAGEAGIINVWSREHGADGASGAASGKLLKSMKKLHVNRKKPY